MVIKIDFSSSEAIYMQLRNQIIIGIASESIKDGETLPSVRQLAEELGVNMHTVNKAYSILKDDGYLRLDRRRGAVVSVSTEPQHRCIESMNVDMRMMVAEAICKDISLAEMHQFIADMYREFGESHDGGNV